MNLGTRFPEDGTNVLGVWFQFTDKKNNSHVYITVDRTKVAIGYNKDTNQGHGSDFAVSIQADGVYFQHLKDGQLNITKIDEELFKKKLLTLLKGFAKVV